MKYGSQSMVNKVDSILIKHPRDAFISQEHLNQNWQSYKYEGCPDFDNAVQEFTEFERIICQWVPVVHYLPLNQSIGIDSIYTHDTVKVTNHGAIYFPMGKTLRKPETLATQLYLEKIGVKTLGHIEGKGKMEGGDIVWLDEQTVAIGLGYRTNEEGIRQFRELTKNFIKEIIVVPLPHADGPDACLHLMSLISMVHQNLAVVYLKYMPVFFKNIMENRGISLINVSDEEYDRLGSNVLALAPGKCVMLQGNSEIQNKLEKAGLEIYPYPGSDLSIKGTGGPTCLTQPIFRTSEMD
ncbi:MAG: amidinotransferase [Deltaproteobacteria bacterium]|jgi:arginine deiminase|nr:amidinotransferase [Deltaproteobacteria bacterium]